MIVLPGSQGGVPGPGNHPGGLASHGYVVLALAYFNAEGLPPLLQNIPLEYFATAVDWLKSQASVDPGRIGVFGPSRGFPPPLQNIPLEYFATGVDWMKSQASVDPGRIGVFGTSRGGELALLL